MSTGLRLVTFHTFPPAYDLVANWAAARGHTIVLVVSTTSPGSGRFDAQYQGLLRVIPPTQDVLLSTRLQRTVAPVLAALAPDLLISATFQRRIPPAVTAIPRYGAVNLHPSALPRGRGPNPQRTIYEGDLTAAGTLHRIAPGFDTGAILSQQSRALPDALTPGDIFAAWMELLLSALDEGVARAVAGDPGTPQDESLATYAGNFTEDETILDWREPAFTIQRRAAALNLLKPLARAWLGPRLVAVDDVIAQPATGAAAPGAILEQAGDRCVVAVPDGAVSLRLVQTLTPTQLLAAETR